MAEISPAMDIINRISTHPSRMRQHLNVSAKVRTEQWLNLIGAESCLYATEFVHVAGTKGKGTTCHYTESILRAYSVNRPLKIACITSPHISDITERFRINSKPISAPIFNKYTQMLWNEMERHLDKPGRPSLPGYPGFLTLLGFFIVFHEKPDVAIFETGIGGEKDSTNAISQACATGVTTLDFDHVNVLGDDISSIAWHKGGIFKSHSRAFTVPQLPAAISMLNDRCREKGCAGELTVVSEKTLKEYGVTVYPDTSYQRLNAALAIQLASTVIHKLDPTFKIHAGTIRALHDTELIGRHEVLETVNNKWLINIAHNDISVKEGSEWFSQTLLALDTVLAPIVLIFAHHSRRDSRKILHIIYQTLLDRFPTAAVILCTYASGIDDVKSDLIDPRRDSEVEKAAMEGHEVVLQELGYNEPIYKHDTVRDAVYFAERSFSGARMIVLGSTYLVGAARYIILSQAFLGGCRCEGDIPRSD